jgi:hypothetical protein
MTTEDFCDLIIDRATRVRARQIVDDALRQLDEGTATLCVDRLEGLRRRAAEEGRRADTEDENLP